MYRLVFKRLLDIAAALVLLLLLSPLLAAICVALLFVNKGQPLFYQQRAGKNGKPFTLVKFKTMTDLRNQHGQLADDQQRLTALGRLLRKTSIDELPQLINVINGSMSLIGPRPLFIKYLPFYRGDEIRRHDVRPGISGWAQVNGRNNLNWQQRLAMDVYYVDHVSVILDARIAYKTVINILLARDVVVDETYLIADLDVERRIPDGYTTDDQSAILQR